MSQVVDKVRMKFRKHFLEGHPVTKVLHQSIRQNHGSRN